MPEETRTPEAMLQEQRAIEVLFAGAIIGSPSVVMDDCGWLEVDTIVDVQVKELWESVKSGRISTQEDAIAEAIKSGLFWRISESDIAGASVMHNEWAAQIAKFAYLHEVSRLGAKVIDSALNLRDENLVRSAIDGLTNAEIQGRVASGSTPEQIDMEFRALLENPPRAIMTRIPALDKMIGGFYPGEMTVLAARPGMGKCLGRGTKVVMYDGTLVPVENVAVGDKLMGADSKPRTVLSVARGVERMYWVRQRYGIPYRVNESHILSLKRRKGAPARWSRKNGGVVNISVADYVEMSNTWKKAHNGYKVEVFFPDRDVEFSPYSVGVLVGGGDVCRRGDDVDALANGAIPQEYISNSTEKRLELLAGVVDSCGDYLRSGNMFRIRRADKELASQIKFVADSLGFRTRLIDENKEVRSLSGRVEKVPSYIVEIQGDVGRIPTRSPRKLVNGVDDWRNWLETDINVEEDTVGDYYGFELDGDGLFLLEDMTVTHNTALAIQIARTVAYSGNKVLMISIEMTREQLWARMACGDSGVEWKLLRAGLVEPVDIEVVKENSKRLAEKLEGKFIVEDDAFDLSSMHSSIIHNKPDLVIIDQLADISWSDPREKKVDWLGKACWYIRQNFAKRMRIPVLVIHQLNRGPEDRNDKRPTLSDLRDSGEIEQRADIVLGCYRDDYYEGRPKDVHIVPFEVIPLKFRQGNSEARAVVDYDLITQWFS